MEEIQLNLCECCALVVANGDDTTSPSTLKGLTDSLSITCPNAFRRSQTPS